MILEATIGSTTYTLPILREAFSIDERCGDAGKHTTSSVSCSVRPIDAYGNNFLSAILSTSDLVSSVIKDGSTTVFTGYIRPYVSTKSANATPSNISLEVMDSTEAMHSYVWKSSDEDSTRVKATVKSNISLKDLMTFLFGCVGKTCNTSGLPDTTLSYFNLAEGDYVDEVIAETLFEFGYDYMWSNDGIASFFTTFLPTTTSGTISDIRNTISTSRSDDTSEGLVVSYSTFMETENALIYSLTYTNAQWNQFMSWKQGQLSGKFFDGVQHDSAFHTKGDGSVADPTENTLDWEPDKSGIKVNNDPLKSSDILYVKTDVDHFHVWLEDETGVTLTKHLRSYDGSGACFWVSYSGWFDWDWTWRIDAYGTVGYRVDSEEKFNVTGADPDKITLKYRMLSDTSGGTDINTFTSAYAKRQFASKLKYTFESTSSYDVGGFYTLANQVEGHSQTVRITGRSKDADGIYTYNAEGADTSQTISINRLYNSTGTSYPRLTAYQQAVAGGYTGTEEDYIKANSTAKVLTLELSSYTYVRNFRTTGSTDVTVKVLTSGYTGSATVTVVDSMGHDLTVTNNVISIPYSNNYDYVTVTATIEDATTSGKISVVDNTQYYKDWGRLESEPTGNTYLEADYYYNTTNKCKYIYDNDAWTYDETQEKYLRIRRATPNTLSRNDRDQTSTQDVSYIAEWTGLLDVSPIWYVDSISDSNKFGEGENASKTYAVAYLSAPTVILCNGTTQSDSLTHSIVDLTSKNMYHGSLASYTAITSVVIDGDYYYDSTKHMPMYRKDGAWIEATETNIGDSVVFNSILATCQRDLLADHVDAGTEVSGEYGYFYNLITRLLIVTTVVSNDYVEGESGFKLDGTTGKMSAVDADLSGAISVDHAYVNKGVFRHDRFYPEVF